MGRGGGGNPLTVFLFFCTAVKAQAPTNRREDAGQWIEENSPLLSEESRGRGWGVGVFSLFSLSASRQRQACQTEQPGQPPGKHWEKHAFWPEDQETGPLGAE